MVNVHLLDLAKSEQSTYAITLANQSDRKSIYTLMGLSVDAKPTAPTFRDLSVWSSEIKSPKPVPSFIDSNFSLVFRTTKADDLKYKLYWIGPEIDKKPLTAKIYDWVDLADNLKEKPEQFQPKE